MDSEDKKLNKIDWEKVMGMTKAIDAWKHVHVEVKDGDEQKVPTSKMLMELMERRAELMGRKMAEKVEEQILWHAMRMMGTNGPNVVFQNSWGGDPPPSMVSQGFSYGESTTEPPLREDEEPIIITSVNE